MAKESTKIFGNVCFWEVGELFDYDNRFLILGQSFYCVFVFNIASVFCL